MDDFTFGLLYSAFGAGLVGILLFLLARGLDRKRYLRPVLYGFFFGVGTSMFFISGLFAFLIGGAVTGYLLAREVSGWWKQFRAGALNGVLIVSSSILAVMYLSFTPVISETAKTGEALFLLYGDTFLYVFMWAAIVGMGAVLGGTLRKLLKPAGQKPIGSGETTSSGVEQQ